MLTPEQFTAHAAGLIPASGPLIIGIDGRSGVGKSTLARRLAPVLGAVVIEGDAFFAGGVGMIASSAAERADVCIDRPKLRAVLEALRTGRTARFRAFDWEAFDGRLQAHAVEVPVTGRYILEGVYACHPDFHDLLDLKALTCANRTLRDERLLAREGVIGQWERQWHEAEDWYFEALMPDGHFDVRVDVGR